MEKHIKEILNNSIYYILIGCSFRVKKEDDYFLLCEIFPEDFDFYSGLRYDEDEVFECILECIDVTEFIQKEGFFEGLFLFAFEDAEDYMYIKEIKVEHYETIENALNPKSESNESVCTLPF